MIISKPLIPIAAVGIVGSGMGGVYTCSLQKLKDFLKDELLGYDESHNEDWKTLQAALNKSNSDEYLAIVGLDKIQNKSETNPSSGEKLKEWCKESVENNISVSERLNTPWQRSLIEAVSKFCILTFKNKLKNPIDLGGDKDQQALQASITKLKSTDTSEELNDELRTIKGMQQDSDAIKGLKDWCGVMYTKGYNDPQALDWKLAEKYCQKNS